MTSDTFRMAFFFAAASGVAASLRRTGLALLILLVLGSGNLASGDVLSQTPSPIRVNAGGAAYTDTQGRMWSADTGFSGGSVYSTSASIAGTSDPTLYQTVRYGAPLQYSFSLPDGSYSVTLKFAEIYFNRSGARVFHVALNGQQVLANFDIFAQAGGKNIAFDRTFPVTVAAGQLTIHMTAVANYPNINAIEIVPQEILQEPAVVVSVSPSSVSLTGGQSQQFSATVTGASDTAVTWSLSPLAGVINASGLYTAPTTVSSQQTVTVTAASVADPTKTAAAIVTLLPAASAIRVNAGGSTYTDTQGRVWSADTGFSGGSVYTTSANIASTSDPTLYQTVRYGSPLQYSFPLPDGSYSVTLKFAEIFFTSAGSRVFHVALNGQQVLANFDIFAQAGGKNIAFDRTFPVTVGAGQLTIQMTAVANYPNINAIQIVPDTLQQSTVAVSVSPSTASLAESQTQEFTATVSGTTDQRVTWSLNPTIGILSTSGGTAVYTAPSTISESQTVEVVATSMADTTKLAKALIALSTLVPTVVVSVTPTTVTLESSQTQQFTASVSGTTDQRVTWSLDPILGTISSAGLYTAPATIDSQQTVTVTATSAADVTKSASARVTLPARARTESGGAIQLPIEVVGPNGFTQAVQVDVPTTPSGSERLRLRIHNLNYQTQASVEVNNSSWIPINDSTATVLGLAPYYGGIGGGFNTLDLVMNLPAGTVVSGLNTVRFRFNETNGRTSGFRVLAFNFVRPDGAALLSPDMFTQEDPNTWQPPLPSPSDISEGRRLWYEAALTTPKPTGQASIRARCTDCHAQEGRDLKYFNYSNNSIRARSMFHGLTAQQGDQIASYIRTLYVPNPGRPWNPPYQPAPGLDAKAVEQWAAGAGLDALLKDDTELLEEIFPNGIQDPAFSASGNLNAREIRIPFQLPDWNQWLPGVHPMDAYGDTFLNHRYNTQYPVIRSGLRPGDAAAYAQQAPVIRAWVDDFINLHIQTRPANYTPELVDQKYSLPLWGMVKTWEIMQEFQLEGLSRTIFKHPAADPRAWIIHLPFLTSPNMLILPAEGIRNGQNSTHKYVAYIWYHLQLVLNNGNKEINGQTPIDWQYIYGFANWMSRFAPPQPALHYLWLIKALQISNNGKGPEFGPHGYGWNWSVNDLSLQVVPSATQWIGVSPSLRAALSEGIIRAWLEEVRKFTPQQFYSGGWTSPTIVPERFAPHGNWADRTWYMIPIFRYVGVSQSLIDQLADWARTIWPNGDWEEVKTATCWLSDGKLRCSNW